MCLLVLFHRCLPGFPLVLCANRDEFFDRPAAPPRIFPAHDPRETSFIAPQDLRAGGTWIGLNRTLGAAAMTNRKAVPARPDAPSRGILCFRVLSQGSAAAMAAAGRSLAADLDLNGFNLLLADQEEARLLSGGRKELREEVLPPGVHVLTNEHNLNEIEIPFGAQWWTRPRTFPDLCAELRSLLERHEPLDGQRFAPCKHFENRGTRSAAIIAAGPAGASFLYAGGPPCATPFEDLEPLLERLAASV